MTNNLTRKIIHIDMDCFYAAIEMRDNPTLANKPVAVGGLPESRSVLCTCNYIARKFGVHSAMASAYARRLCPDLIILPVNMEKYREASAIIHKIFREYTPLIEPLSLDEAFLDVTNSNYCQGSATWIAEEIRQKILKETQLTASAGIAPNKFLAKIASGWNKPNGQFVVLPQHIERFIKDLPVNKLFGVGKVTTQKLHALNLKTCADLHKLSLASLTDHFGKRGKQFYEQSRGIDNRSVNPNQERKSLSVERTFSNDMAINASVSQVLPELYEMLINRIKKYTPHRKIKNQYLKIKSTQFKVSTVEKSCTEVSFQGYEHLLYELEKRENSAIRLLGIGVHFSCEGKESGQQSLFVEGKI